MTSRSYAISRRKAYSFDSGFKPRPARQRGGSYTNYDRNANNICIFTAIDDRGHVLTRFTGVGITNYTALKNHIPSDKFLLQVPKSDSFKSLMKKQSSEPRTVSGNQSLMIADAEGAIKKYAEFVGIEFESHVYRRDGIQMRLSKDAHNIQRVNALHKRLKAFLRESNYVSTKYLPGYLILFEFIENTGASQAAIERLFQILATPNLGKPASFYQDMYSVPNYLQEWLEGNNPLKKIPYNKLLAFYLYDHIRRKEEYPDVLITMDYIEKESGYTAPTIRKAYRELNAAGYRDMILSHFGEPKKKTKSTEKPKRKKSKERDALTSLNPIVLAIYDEYAEMRTLPKSQRKTFNEFLKEKNAQYGTNYKRTNMLAKFDLIASRGARPELPQFISESHIVNGNNLPQTAFSILDDFEKIVLSYRERGEAVPSHIFIYTMLSERYGISAETVKSYVVRARYYLKKNGKNRTT